MLAEPSPLDYCGWMEQRKRSRSAVQFGGFVFAGGVGFIVDAGVLAVGLALGLPAWLARVPSFVMAVVATWILNRRIAFRAEKAPSWVEFRNYLFTMSIGLMVNYGTYLVLLGLGVQPLWALGIGSCAGMFVNFLGARRVLGG